MKIETEAIRFEVVNRQDDLTVVDGDVRNLEIVDLLKFLPIFREGLENTRNPPLCVCLGFRSFPLRSYTQTVRAVYPGKKSIAKVKRAERFTVRFNRFRPYDVSPPSCIFYFSCNFDQRSFVLGAV